MTARCGTHLGYRDHQTNHTTTCQPCRDAQAAWQRDYEKRRVMAGARYVQRRHPLEGGHLIVDATGTRRRLQALAVMGWRGCDLEERSGISRRYLSELVARDRPMVMRETAVRVAALYDELSMTPGPSTYVARLSRGKGWAAPLQWDDEDIDDPAARPSPPRTGHEPRRQNRDPDLEERIMALVRSGHSSAEIAVQLRTYKRQVDRVRARYRTEGAA